MLGVPATNTQAVDNTMIPFPSNISVSFHRNATTVDVYWISNTTSPLIPTSNVSVNTFFLNVTYLGPCENYTQILSREIVHAHSPSQSQVVFAETVPGLQEYSNYSVSVEGVSSSTMGRSPPAVVTFQTKVGGEYT